MRRAWGKTGASEVKGRTALRRARIVAFGVLLAAGLLASGALGQSGLNGIFTSSGSPTDTSGFSFLTASPTISSDQADYTPGSTVTLTGHNWAADETVHIFVNDDEGQSWSYSTDVSADATGDFMTQFV